MTTLIIFGVLAFVEIVEAIAFGGIVKSILRSSARREDLLVNQLCHLAGRSWTPAPADEWEPTEELEELLAAPEQLPDY